MVRLGEETLSAQGVEGLTHRVEVGAGGGAHLRQRRCLLDGQQHGLVEETVEKLQRLGFTREIELQIERGAPPIDFEKDLGAFEQAALFIDADEVLVAGGRRQSQKSPIRT